MKIVKQIVRGLGPLPHVMDPPGFMLPLGFASMGALLGAPGGFAGAVTGAAIMLAVYIPMYIRNAYVRAEDNNEIEAELKK